MNDWGEAGVEKSIVDIVNVFGQQTILEILLEGEILQCKTNKKPSFRPVWHGAHCHC